jgi:hypothetical protein
MHRQIRALVIMDALIQNLDGRFQRSFGDGPLVERLEILTRDEMVDPEVRTKARSVVMRWGLGKGNAAPQTIVALAKALKQDPRTRRAQPQNSRIVQQQDAEVAREREEHSPPAAPTQNRRSDSHHAASASMSSQPVFLGNTAPLPSGSSIFRSHKKDKKSKGKPFNLEKEKGQLLETIASANVASTNLLNGLQLINREHQRVSENPEVMKRFETCKQLRRQVLRYIHLVESEQYIGGLLSANDDLVKGLMAFELMDKSIDDDSDSDHEMSSEPAAPAKPPRPTSIPMPPAPAQNKHQAAPESEPEEDEDDPFGDSNGTSILT